MSVRIHDHVPDFPKSRDQISSLDSDARTMITDYGKAEFRDPIQRFTKIGSAFRAHTEREISEAGGEGCRSESEEKEARSRVYTRLLPNLEDLEEVCPLIAMSLERQLRRSGSLTEHE
jgi:hypothetical protein